jgi:UDP-N-acetylmuramate: L-alanyl-gamma-D-glutamyl-meso-diaminopimelate ligase
LAPAGPSGCASVEAADSHNASAQPIRAIAASAIVAVALAAQALGRFESVRRPLEVRGTGAGFRVQDDCAHRPTNIRLTLEGLRTAVGGVRILAVLEPRSNTMTLGLWKDALTVSLAAADRVFCYTAHIGPDAQAALAPQGTKASVFGDLAQLVAAITAEARPGDHVLIMSIGGFGGIHENLLVRLAGSYARDYPERPNGGPGHRVGSASARC